MFIAEARGSVIVKKAVLDTSSLELSLLTFGVGSDVLKVGNISRVISRKGVGGSGSGSKGGCDCPKLGLCG